MSFNGAGYERSIDKLPGYARVQALCPEEPVLEAIQPDPVLLQLRQLHYDRVLYGDHLEELRRTQEIRVRDFGVMPEPDEDVACTSGQLFAWCRKHGVNHLIYTGFAVNACLVSSPCGRIDMTRRGLCAHDPRPDVGVGKQRVVLYRGVQRTRLVRLLGLGRIHL